MRIPTCLGKTAIRVHALSWAIMGGILLTPPAAWAQGDFFADIEVSDQSEEEANNNWNFKGYVQQKLKYGFDTPDQNFYFSRDEEGITQLRTDIFTELTYRPADQLSFVLSGKAELDALEWNNGEQDWGLEDTEFFLKDAYVDWVFGDEQWLRVGHQLFAWGESEMLAISDIMSPYDLREQGQTELRDIREQVPALLYSFPAMGGKLSLVTTYYAGHNRYAEFNEEFNPLQIPLEYMSAPHERDPDKQWEAAIKYDYYLNGGDIRVLAAEVNDNNLIPSFKLTEGSFLVQDRVYVFAVAANRVMGSLQFKTEVGMRWGQRIETYVEEDQLRAMLGLEYTGMNDWLFSLEVDTIQGQKLSIEAPLFSDQEKTDTYGGNVHIQNTALNERLTQNWWYFHLLEEGGGVFRWDVAYDWNDSWEISAALVLYEEDATDGILYPYRNNDTFNVAAKYSF